MKKEIFASLDFFPVFARVDLSMNEIEIRYEGKGNRTYSFILFDIYF